MGKGECPQYGPGAVIVTKCARCGNQAETRMVAVLGHTFEHLQKVSKELCEDCAEAVLLRLREWCGETKSSNNSWLEKGWP